MSDKDLHRNPKPLLILDSGGWVKAEDFWYYEEPRGLTIVIQNEQLLIPWRQIRNALKRKDR